MYCAQSPLKFDSKSRIGERSGGWPGSRSTIDQRAAWMNDSARSLSARRGNRWPNLKYALTASGPIGRSWLTAVIACA